MKCGSGRFVVEKKAALKWLVPAVLPEFWGETSRNGASICRKFTVGIYHFSRSVFFCCACPTMNRDKTVFLHNRPHIRGRLTWKSSFRSVASRRYPGWRPISGLLRIMVNWFWGLQARPRSADHNVII